MYTVYGCTPAKNNIYICTVLANPTYINYMLYALTCRCVSWSPSTYLGTPHLFWFQAYLLRNHVFQFDLPWLALACALSDRDSHASKLDHTAALLLAFRSAMAGLGVRPGRSSHRDTSRHCIALSFPWQACHPRVRRWAGAERVQ